MRETTVVHLRRAHGDAATALTDLLVEVAGPGPWEFTHACPGCGSANHGRLLVRDGDVHVSLARPRDEGPAVVAVCQERAVGVDVEALGAAAFDGFDDVALHPSERCGDDIDKTRAWTRKEALLKAHGTGLATDPQSVHLAEDGTVLAGPAGSIVDAIVDGQQIAVAVVPPAVIELVWH